jgi:hypothetical protein
VGVEMKNITFIPLNEDTEVDFPQPRPSTALLPTWYKSIPQFFNEEKELRVIPGTQMVNATVKRCTPFLDAMTAGYTVTLPDDVQVQRGEDGLQRLWWRTQANIITEHGPEQYPGFPIPTTHGPTIFKWANEWSIATPPGYSLYCTHPANRYDLPFLTISGFVDTDKYPLAIQFPFLIRKDFEGIIERGTPVAQLIPVKREDWRSEKAVYDPLVQKKSVKQFFGRIDRAYKSQFWSKKTYQ